MSKYSGKCDFYDYMSIHSNSDDWDEMFEKFNGTELFVNTGSPSTDKQILYSSIEDICEFFPYIVSVSAGNKVWLSSKPYTDISETEMLNIMLKDALRYYNSCKRKKISFNKEEAEKKMPFSLNGPVAREVLNRVEKNGKKANIDGLHLYMEDIYRKSLKDDIEKYKATKKES